MELIKNKEQLQLLLDIIKYCLNEDTCNLAHNLLHKYINVYDCHKFRHRHASYSVYNLGSIPNCTMFYDSTEQPSIEVYKSKQNETIDSILMNQNYYTRIYLVFFDHFSSIKSNAVINNIEKYLKTLNDN